MPISIFALFVTIPVVALTLTLVFFIRQSSEPAPSEPKETFDDWKKARNIGYWTSSVILSVVYIIAGAPKLTGLNETLHRFSEWGYSEDFMLFIGASEFIAAIFLLIPRTSLYAASYLGIIMMGAIYTHLAFDTATWALLPAFCLSFLGFIAYEDWQRHHRHAGKRGRLSGEQPA